jgi:hypothetical protein
MVPIFFTSLSGVLCNLRASGAGACDAFAFTAVRLLMGVGCVDEVRVFKVRYTQAQVIDLMHRGSLTNEEYHNLTMWWTFDEGALCCSAFSR